MTAYSLIYLMTMMKYASLSLALVLGLSFITAEAHAQLIDVNGSAGVNTTVTDTADVDADVSAGATADEGTASSDAEASSDAAVVADFSFSRDDINQDIDYTITDAGSVRSSAGLESYVAASVRDDERLESVAVADGRMDIRYRKNVKFLWVMPSSMRVDVAVANNGDVTVRYPWYSFLMATGESRAALEARLEAEVASIDSSAVMSEQTELSTTATAGIQTGGADVYRWARVLDRMHTVLSASGSVEG